MSLKQTEEEKYTLLGGVIWMVIIGAIAGYGWEVLNSKQQREVATESRYGQAHAPRSQREIVESPPPKPGSPDKPQPFQPNPKPEKPQRPVTIPKNPTPAQFRCLEHGGGLKCFEPDYIGTIFESYFLQGGQD